MRLVPEAGAARSKRALEAYGIFELGPEQRLRGIAPSLFQRIEGLFWYGDGDHAGLVQLVKRKDAGAELDADARRSRRRARRRVQRVGTGAIRRRPSSRTARSSSSAKGSRRC